MKGFFAATLVVFLALMVEPAFAHQPLDAAQDLAQFDDGNGPAPAAFVCPAFVQLHGVAATQPVKLPAQPFADCFNRADYRAKEANTEKFAAIRRLFLARCGTGRAN